MVGTFLIEYKNELIQKKTYAGKQQFILYEMRNVIIHLPHMNGNKGESKRLEPPKNDNI